MPLVFGSACRRHFSIDDNLIFLNNGSFGAPPNGVLSAQANYRAITERSPIYYFQRVLPAMMRESAQLLGQFIGAPAENLAFTENATTAVNSVVFSIAPSLKPGDCMLTTSHVYGAVRQTLRHYAAWTGAEVLEIPAPFPLSDSSEIVEAVAAALTPKVKFAVFDHIASPSGIIFPIRELVNLCKERSIPVLVDGAHAPGMLELNMSDIGADWYAGNCHKWLFAPKGCAFLYSSPERLRSTHSLVVSHGYGNGYAAEFDFVGTKDYSAFLALRDALAFYRENGGYKGIGEYNRTLAANMRKMLAEAWGAAPPAPENMLGSLAALPIPRELTANDANAAALHDELFNNYRIEVPITLLNNRLWIRFSAQIFNEPDDYYALAGALPKAAESVGKRNL